MIHPEPTVTELPRTATGSLVGLRVRTKLGRRLVITKVKRSCPHHVWAWEPDTKRDGDGAKFLLSDLVPDPESP